MYSVLYFEVVIICLVFCVYMCCFWVYTDFTEVIALISLRGAVNCDTERLSDLRGYLLVIRI